MSRDQEMLEAQLREVYKDIYKLKVEYAKNEDSHTKKKIKKEIKNKQYQAMFYREKINNLIREEEENL